MILAFAKKIGVQNYTVFRFRQTRSANKSQEMQKETVLAYMNTRSLTTSGPNSFWSKSIILDL